MKRAPREVRSSINTYTRSEFGPVWRDELRGRISTRLDARVFGGPGNRLKAGNPPELLAAQSKRALRGGLIPSYMGRAIEFGVKNANRKTTFIRTSPRGRRHYVTRTAGGNLPTYVPGGRIAYPAFREVAPRLVSLWVQIVMRKVYDAVRE